MQHPWSKTAYSWSSYSQCLLFSCIWKLTISFHPCKFACSVISSAWPFVLGFFHRMCLFWGSSICVKGSHFISFHSWILLPLCAHHFIVSNFIYWSAFTPILPVATVYIFLFSLAFGWILQTELMDGWITVVKLPEDVGKVLASEAFCTHMMHIHTFGHTSIHMKKKKSGGDLRTRFFLCFAS